MKKSVLLYYMTLLFSVAFSQQQKQPWYTNYRVGANTSLLKGSADEYTTIAAFADAGRYLKNNFLIGAGGGFINFQNNKKVTVVYSYIEKNIGGNKRKLFFYAKPGAAFAYKPAVQLQSLDRNEYWKTVPGFHLQAGTGIRWMIDRHSFFISTGLSKTGYAIYTKEYPVVVDPYNPFVENAIVHTYKFAFNKLQFNIGFTF